MSAPEGTLVKEYQVVGIDGTIYTFQVWLTKIETSEPPPPPDDCPTGQHRDPVTGECVPNEPPPPPPPPPPTDLEEIAIVTATSNRDDGNVASNVISPDIARWSCQGTDCELLLDLGHVNEVGEVFITFFRGAERTENFEVGFSQDNTNYILVPESQQQAANAIIKVSPLIKARYVKFLGKGNNSNDWNSIEYVKISGKKLAPPEPCPPETCPPNEHWDTTQCKCVPDSTPPPPPPPTGAVGTVAPGVTVPLTFPSTPGDVGMHSTAEVFGNDTRQEAEIHAGGAHVEGVYCAYHKHAGVGDDEYSWKFGFGGDGGEYEQIIKMGGKQEAGGRWEANHNNYSDVPDPEKVSVLPGMSNRVNNGLVTNMDNKEQGFQVVKTRSPNDDANIYDIFVDDRDGQGWKYAFTKRFGDDDYDQTGRGYNDSAFRLEIRYQDMNGTVDYSDLNYKQGRPNGYVSPLIGGSPPPPPCQPTPCPAGQHFDMAQCKCVPDSSPPPPTGQLGPYPSTGRQIDCDIDDEAGTRHYASGKDDDRTIEAEADGIAFSNYQFVVDVTMKEVEHDDQVSLKYGGTHTGTGWFDNTVSFSEGETCLGKEEDHPSTDLCVERGPKIGNILNKRLKVAGVYHKERNHIELWTNFEGSGWIKQLEATDLGGFNPGADEDEATLRIDGFAEGGRRPGEGNVPTIHAAFVQEIADTGSSTSTAAAAATTTTKKSRGKGKGKAKTAECGDCNNA